MDELKLFMISRTDDDYGKTYLVLVAATGEAEARKLTGRYERDHGGQDPFSWVDDNDSTAVHIGTAADSTSPGVLMTKESAN